MAALGSQQAQAEVAGKVPVQALAALAAQVADHNVAVAPDEQDKVAAEALTSSLVDDELCMDHTGEKEVEAGRRVRLRQADLAQDAWQLG